MSHQGQDARITKRVALLDSISPVPRGHTSLDAGTRVRIVDAGDRWAEVNVSRPGGPHGWVATNALEFVGGGGGRPAPPDRGPRPRPFDRPAPPTFNDARRREIRVPAIAPPPFDDNQVLRLIDNDADETDAPAPPRPGGEHFNPFGAREERPAPPRPGGEHGGQAIIKRSVWLMKGGSKGSSSDAIVFLKQGSNVFVEHRGSVDAKVRPKDRPNLVGYVPVSALEPGSEAGAAPETAGEAGGVEDVPAGQMLLHQMNDLWRGRQRGPAEDWSPLITRGNLVEQAPYVIVTLTGAPADARNALWKALQADPRVISVNGMGGQDFGAIPPGPPWEYAQVSLRFDRLTGSDARPGRWDLSAVPPLGGGRSDTGEASDDTGGGFGRQRGGGYYREMLGGMEWWLMKDGRALQNFGRGGDAQRQAEAAVERLRSGELRERDADTGFAGPWTTFQSGSGWGIAFHGKPQGPAHLTQDEARKKVDRLNRTEVGERRPRHGEPHGGHPHPAARRHGETGDPAPTQAPPSPRTSNVVPIGLGAVVGGVVGGPIGAAIGGAIGAILGGR